MKAMVFTQYGPPDVLTLTDVPTPAPKDREVLVRVHAVSINDWDVGALQGDMLANRFIFGLVKPKIQILGSDVAGTVEAVGGGVTRFRPGDAVYGDLSGAWGGFAEYVCARETALLRKPAGMSFEQAAAVPQAALLALQGLDMAQLRPGQRLLINGAGGGVGTFAIQIATDMGVDVTAVDRPEKLEMLRTMGARRVIDYTREDFTTGGAQYDVILDVKSNRSPFAYAAALRPNGTYVTVGGSNARLLQALVLGPWISLTRKKHVRILVLKPNRGLERMGALFEDGKVVPVIDRCYPLEQLADAFRFFGSANHKGKVVISVGGAEARA